MRVRSLKLVDFKRFHDLTIDLTDRSTKLVALVGPNGSGKSSVFDAFEEFGARYKGRPGKSESYYRKSFHEPGKESAARYDGGQNITLETDQNEYANTSVYIRSAYRFTPRIKVEAIRSLPNPSEDQNRPQYLIETDARLTENYERLIGRFFGEVYNKDIRGADWVINNIKSINDSISNVLDIEISSLGNPTNQQGSLYFDKGISKNFPYENLSAGEKEVIDLVLDLYVKKDIATNSIICIDEPELHISTGVQRKLLNEIAGLIPDGSQLWVATHSIGFLRALQEEQAEHSTVIDFTGENFDQATVLRPIKGTRADWSRIFATALEDLTGLLSPRRIIYCEGRPEPATDGEEQGLDAEAYNSIFELEHGDTVFVSSGGGGEVARNALLAVRILGKALKDVGLHVLKDRDDSTDDERASFLEADPSRRMLTRREIENFLFDKEVVSSLAAECELSFDEARYDAAVHDVRMQDLKPAQQEIQASCGFVGRMAEFKLALARQIKPGSLVFRELEAAIFP
jgi:predicted ATPase